ncbi:MAG: hypothetical protein GC160_02595 [Acidobacteria bacterium]|nr:hypothetical protein [Acidobacteriota bacterium]
MLQEIRDFCWPLSIALLGLWAVQIIRFRLAKRYSALLAYLVTAFLLGGGGYIAERFLDARWLGHSFYFWYWAASQPVLWLLLFAVVFECFSRMTESYQGLRRLGRLVVLGLAGGVVTVIGLVVILDPFENPNPRFWNSVLLIQQQSVYFATAGSVMLLLAIRRFFNIPVARNLRTTMGVLGVYFISVAAMTAIRSYVGYVSRELDIAVDVAGLVIYCACVLFGAAVFSRGGEDVASDPRISADSADALRSASGRLQEVNAHLLKAVAK